MVEDNLLVSSTISAALVARTLDLGMEMVTSFGRMYKEAVTQFQEMNVDAKNFFKFNVAVINNSSKFPVLFQVKMKDKMNQRSRVENLYWTGDGAEMG